jgi:predicted PurR-regulated permease PerM
MTTERNEKVIPILSLVAGLVLLAIFVYSILPSLSPAVLAAGVVFLFYPLRQEPFIRRFLWLTVLLFAAWVFTALRGVFTPFIIAALLAYLFRRLVDVLERHRIPRWVSSCGIVVLLVGSVVVLIVFFIPILVVQLGNILEIVSQFAKNVVQVIQQGTLSDTLRGYGLPADRLTELISKELPSHIEGILKSILEGAFGIFTGITSIVGSVIDAVIIPFLALYLMKDYWLIMGELRSLLPVSHREAIVDYFEKVDRLLGEYLRGMLVVALIQGTGVTLGLLILGVPDALLLGIVSGILNLIPFVGFYLSMVISAIVTIVGGGGVGMKLLGVLLLYVGLNILENTVVGPRIVGRKVGLHPVLLILALAVFGYMLGFVGLVLAVPATAVLLMTFTLLREKRSHQP